MRDEASSGRKIAAVLAGSWRTNPPSLVLSADALPDTLPLLQETGAGSLAYRRLNRSGAGTLPAVRQLRQTYRLHTLETAVWQTQLRELVRRFRSAGVDPLIVKGWSISRLYPEPGLRPFGDIDVCIRPEDRDAAAAVLTEAAGVCGVVDLHTGVADLDDRRLDELYRRSRLVPLADGEVRILSPEDQLRHLCLHLMRHGAWRPLWLCDVAVALESLPADFDWNYCRSGDRRLTEWVDCALELATQLLGARARFGEEEKRQLPRWMVPAVLRIWQRGSEANDAVTEPLADCWRTGASLCQALRHRWPNPIRAAFKLGLSPFAPWPRRLIQLAAFSQRACQFAMHQLAANNEFRTGGFTVHPARVR